MNAALALPSYLSRSQTRPTGFYKAVDQAYRKIAGNFLIGRRYAESLNPWKRGTANAVPDQPPPTQMPSGPVKPLRSVAFAPAVTPRPSSLGKAAVSSAVGGAFRSLTKWVCIPTTIAGRPSFVCFFANRKKEELEYA